MLSHAFWLICSVKMMYYNLKHHQKLNKKEVYVCFKHFYADETHFSLFDFFFYKVPTLVVVYALTSFR